MCLFDNNIILDEFGAKNDWSVNLALVECPVGGKYSMYRKPTKGCHSFREETTQFACLDAFYDGQDWKAKAFAKEWVDKNENEIGKRE